MKDENKNIIYIGKAIILKNRVKQYFQLLTNQSPKVQIMVPKIKEFEYIVTDTELEALILECNLIKKYKPKYNILLKDDNPRDSMGIAKALSKEIKSHKFDVVFCGKQSVDYDAGAVPQMLAEFLDYSCATVVVALKMDGNKIIAEREVEGGREVVELELPAVIGAQKGLNEPRYASLKGIMSAKKKTIEDRIFSGKRKTAVATLGRASAMKSS